ncbi:hypothetical protein Glove_574g41 [Diversispora epigaea]|uniref:Uncharacterized protein n=1 Tax=Diversispora epigaea TaxID=1348612 RepID=A0A397GB32_9GLOM|nr:hypothetical protein Glove_574g41 [Diversispora epigaea]
MSQESRVELSSLQNEPSSAHNEPESSETSKKSVDISSLKEKYNIRLPRSYKEQTSAPQTVHFSEELESTISETVDELKTAVGRLRGLKFQHFSIISLRNLGISHLISGLSPSQISFARVASCGIL